MGRHAEDSASRSGSTTTAAGQPFRPISESTDLGWADGRAAPTAPEYERGIR
jgi:hypothetical protein